MTITAQYKCDDREYTVEVIDTDGEDVTIACNVFPMVFVRHVGWCEQPTMTVNKKWIYNVRDIEADELEQEKHKALQIVLDVTAPAWQIEAEAQAADYADLKATEDNARF